MSAAAASPTPSTFGVPLRPRRALDPRARPQSAGEAAPRRGIEVYPAPPSQKMRIGRRYAREGELEDFLAAEVRANRAISDAARKTDIPCEQVMPNDLGDWRADGRIRARPLTAAARICARSRRRSSPSRRARRRRLSAARASARCWPNWPTALPVQLVDAGAVGSTRPARPRRSKPAKVTLTARAVIVTVSTNVLAAGQIKFAPELPKRQLDAIAGSHSAATTTSRWSSSAIRSASTATIWCSKSPPTAAPRRCSPTCPGRRSRLVEVAGTFGRDLSAAGEAAMVDFAHDGSPTSTAPTSRKRSAAPTRRAGTTSRGARRIVRGVPGGQGARKH